MIHKTVLKNKIRKIVEDNAKGEVYVDATLGAGGHFFLILDFLLSQNDEKILIGFDLDQKALENSKNKLEKAYEFKKTKTGNILIKDKIKVILINENFKNIKSSLKKYEISKIDFVLADLGLTQDEIENYLKGFSYNKYNEILDMRIDNRLNVKASDLLNALSPKELEKLFSKFADIKDKTLSREIVKRRRFKLFKTTGDLLKLINNLHFKNARLKTENFKARVFQALRIAINLEFENLRIFLDDSFNLLNINGIMAIIFFHSGEDDIIKNFFDKNFRKQRLEYIKKLDRADIQELKENPRSASAKLRVIKKIK